MELGSGLLLGYGSGERKSRVLHCTSWTVLNARSTITLLAKIQLAYAIMHMLSTAKSANVGFWLAVQLFAPPTNPANVPHRENSFYKSTKTLFWVSTMFEWLVVVVWLACVALWWMNQYIYQLAVCMVHRTVIHAASLVNRLWRSKKNPQNQCTFYFTKQQIKQRHARRRQLR